MTTRKYPSGTQKRKIRKAKGLPPLASDLAAKRRKDARQWREKYDRMRSYVDSLKVDRGCADCGYNAHPAALDFDHLPGSAKVATIAKMIGGYVGLKAALEKVQAEISKCEVVCANCHRIRTWNRRRSQK
jgi:hypothetical protein